MRYRRTHLLYKNKQKYSNRIIDLMTAEIIIVSIFFQTTDWKFPFRKSSHPVCIHDARERIQITLKNCDEKVDPNTKTFEVLRALSCKCSTCKSSEATCEGIREKEFNFHPNTIPR